jgi:hypothetical protein
MLRRAQHWYAADQCEESTSPTIAFRIGAEIFAQTNGKNTAFFPGRDAIGMVSPDPNELRAVFRLGVPRRTTYECVEVTCLDLKRSLHSGMVLLKDKKPGSALIYPPKKPR